MKISWNWLSELVDLSGVGGPKGLADLLTRRGLEVEEIHSRAQGFEKVVSAKILERNPHPQADRLSLCKVTLGSGDPLEIVCGAQNMKAGDTVALAQIGALLPNGLKIAQSKIRGVTSNGMLCSEEELKLKDKSEGILILPPSTPLGKPLAEILGLDDTVLTFKLTANRGDCLSHFGMAREVAAAIGKPVKAHEPKAIDFSGKGSAISLRLDAGDMAPQFYGCSIEGVKIGPSPAWVVKRLEAVGSRSINNVVDASNLVMLELGHPVHVYDADRIEGKLLGVRLARTGEELPLLDGSKVTLSGSELVITDGRRAVGLAGVMGGGNSEVQDGTTRVFLECAEFAPSVVRRAASKHQKRTEAAHRFERGVDPTVLPRVMARLAELVTELGGGKITGGVKAVLPSREPKPELGRHKVRVNPAYFSSFLGLGNKLTPEVSEKMLKAQGCTVEKSGSEWTVVTPPYRLDLRLKQDLAEEVARSVGYDQIPSTVPVLTTQPTPGASDPNRSEAIVLERAKEALVEAGLMETLNFAYTSRSWLSEFGMSSKLKLMNPLSEELEYLVPSLVPGLVRNALDNWRHHFGSESLAIRLFELRPTFHHADGSVAARGEMETGVTEKWMLSLVVSGPRYAQAMKQEQAEVDFFDLKAILEELFQALGTRGIRFQPLSGTRTPDAPMVKMLHPGQSVEILAGNQVAGYLGLLHPGLGKKLKTRAPLWIAELDWAVVAKLSRSGGESRTFKAMGEFPPMERDFALVVKDTVAAEKITSLALKAGKPLAKSARVFDVYRGAQVAEGSVSVAVRVVFSDEARSLQESETEAASGQILEAWKKELGAELRG